MHPHNEPDFFPKTFQVFIPFNGVHLNVPVICNHDPFWEIAVCVLRGVGGDGSVAAAQWVFDYQSLLAGGDIFRKGATLVSTWGLLWMKNSYGPNFLQGLGNTATDRCSSYFFEHRARWYTFCLLLHNCTKKHIWKNEMCPSCPPLLPYMDLELKQAHFHIKHWHAYTCTIIEMSQHISV